MKEIRKMKENWRKKTGRYEKNNKGERMKE